MDAAQNIDATPDHHVTIRSLGVHSGHDLDFHIQSAALWARIMGHDLAFQIQTA